VNAFFDFRVLLDVFLKRQPYAADAMAVINLVEQRRIQGWVSSILFNNVDYSVRKRLGRSKSTEILRGVMDLFEVVPLDRSILEESMTADIADFEDAIQYFSALRTRAGYLVMREVTSFPLGKIEVLSPRELLVLVGSHEQA
jgi:predicted nucleic acid-binding protein